MPVRFFDEARRKQRNDCNTEHQRNDECYRKDNRQATHVFPGLGLPGYQRYECENNSERRYQKRDEHSLTGHAGRFKTRFAFGDAPFIVLNDDDAVVDKDAESNDDGGDGDLMQFDPDCLHDEESDKNRHRNDSACYKAAAPSQEQHDDAQNHHDSFEEDFPNLLEFIRDDFSLIGNCTNFQSGR